MSLDLTGLLIVESNFEYVRACAAPSLTVLLIVESENEYVRMHASKLETTVRADDGHVCVSRRDGQDV